MMMKPVREYRSLPLRAAMLAGLLLAVATLTPVSAQDKSIRGFVDGQPFLEFYDEDCGTLVEVSLPPSLLRLAAAFVPDGGNDVADLAAGLEWIGAVIVEICDENDSDLARARQMIVDTRKQLVSKGWTQLTRIRERGSTVDVMVLNDATTVSGVVVIVQDDQEIVFANVAGIIDMEKLARLGEQLDLPGLEHVDDDEDDG